MNKYMPTMFLIMFSSAVIAEDVVYQIGSLELVKEFNVKDASYESGHISKSLDAKLIKETNTIDYKIGNAFGVILENLKPDTIINATWSYPKKDSRGQYRYSEVQVSDRHFIYWVLDKGELAGHYVLEITLNNKALKKISFNVK